MPNKSIEPNNGQPEWEAKYRLLDAIAMERNLTKLGFQRESDVIERDAYFDSADRQFEKLDVVLATRDINGEGQLRVKGPRTFTANGDYTRFEVSIPIASVDKSGTDFRAQGLVRTWALEKQRITYRQAAGPVVVTVDDLPEIGTFLEINGPIHAVQQLADQLSKHVEGPIRANYKDLIVARREYGATFSETQ